MPEQPAHHDVLVLGLGGMGTAALAHLAARGLSAVGVEQDDVPSLWGSSVGETRVIRKAYLEDARYVPLLVRAYALWRELEERERASLYVRTGCLVLGPRDHAAVRGTKASAEQHGLLHSVLAEDEVRARLALVPAPGDEGVFEEDAGFLRVEACTAAHARWAKASGATLRTRTRVTELDLGGGKVRATLEGGERLTADKLVVSAGAWLASAPGLAEIARDVPLVVERQAQLWFRSKAREATRPPALPVFIHFTGAGTFYGLPPDEAHEAPAVKVCRHHGGTLTQADALDRVVHDEDEAPVRRYVHAHLPAADGERVRARICMYTNTPDEHFLVGAHPRWPHVVVLGGFSGHGYKMASVMGEIAADLVATGTSRFDLGMFRVGRFG
jgi:sarcosine oxidase